MRLPALIFLILAAGSVASGLEMRKTYGPADLTTWTYPKGLVTIEPSGTSARRFVGPYNAVSDREEYSATIIGQHGTSKLRTDSNPGQIGRIADQDPTTWWKPAEGDPTEKWWVEVDLGRVVAATRIRVVFPDTVGARPFAFFSVYTSPGVPLKAADQMLYFSRVGRPVNGNTDRSVEFELDTVNQAVATGQYLATDDTLRFNLVRFVRFEAGGRTKDAALAEIELETVGFDLALRVSYPARVDKGLEVWGGRTWTSAERTCTNCGKGTSPEGIIDGDLAGRYWAIEAGTAIGFTPDWRQWGNWWGADLGSVFRVERLIWVPLVVGYTPFLYGFDQERQSPWNTFDFLTSDGTRSNTADPLVEGPYQYDLVSSIDNTTAPKRWLFDLQFPPKPVRLVFWRKTSVGEGSWGRAAQLFIYPSEGYPAQVVFESEDMDLGKAYSIRRVEWDADMPDGTRVEVETQTGNGYQKVTVYTDANGKELADKAAFDALKPKQRGQILEKQIRDTSWSNWSLPHRFSGQEFLSPTPRQWLRVRVRLISDEPDAFPSLRSLSFVMTPPVISSGVTGEFQPREAALDSLQEFRYLISPGSSAFYTGEIDVASLLGQVARAAAADPDSPGKRLWGLFPLSTQLEVTAGAADDARIIELLNRLLSRRDYYRERDFAGLALPAEAQVLLQRDRQSLYVGEVRRLNRLLLETAFRGTVPKRQTVAAGDLGFDQVLIVLPPESVPEAAFVGARVAGQTVAASGAVRADSLLVQLPPPVVKSDFVEVAFKARVFQTPTVFQVFVLNSAQADNTQAVLAADLGSDQVYVPQAVQAVSLFQNVFVSRAFTPNGDGANDVCRIEFDLIKTDRAATVRIVGLDGASVAEVPVPPSVTGRTRCTWDGRGTSGTLVPPGVYIVRLRVVTDAGEETVHRVVDVAY